MIKKAVHFGLIIMLLLSTMGVTIYKHYCGSTFVKQTIILLPKSCCNDNCPNCHNKAKQLKITDSFENVASFEKSTTTLALLPVFYNFESINTIDQAYFSKLAIDISPHKIEKSSSMLQVFRM